MTRFSTTRKSLVALLALVLGIALAACGSSEEEPAGEQSEQTPAAEADPAVWPMTGLAMSGKKPKRPIILLKMPNTSEDAPQIGLSAGDLVTEELVEGGFTRLAVAYDKKLPDVVGPVRSMRASDIGIAKPANAVIATSGGAPPTVSRVRAAGIPFYDEGAEGMYRATDRVRPYNLMLRLSDFAKQLSEKRGKPRNYLPWGESSEFAGKGKATKIQARFGNSRTTLIDYADGHYVNTNSFTDDDFLADTVLIIRVDTKDAGYSDPGGSYVPETVYEGEGEMRMFHKGKVVRGTWRKKDLGAELILMNKAGKKLTVPTGKTYIGLVPNDDKGGNLAFQP